MTGEKIHNPLLILKRQFSFNPFAQAGTFEYFKAFLTLQPNCTVKFYHKFNQIRLKFIYIKLS